MTKIHKICLFSLLIACLLALCGCSAGDVTLPQRVDLFAGQQFPLASAVEIAGNPDPETALAACAIAQAQGVTVECSSGDETVVTVDQTGILTAVAPGQTTVTIQCSALGYTAQVAVQVLQPAAGLTVTPQLALQPGETASLDPAVQNADTADLIYTVENPAVAAVDAGGNVTALAEGSTRITAALPGSTLTAVCTVTVGSPVTEVQLSRPDARLTVGERLTLAAAVNPEAAAPVEWQSSDPAVARVDGGVVTALAPGQATITAGADGLTAACTVTVQPASTPETDGTETETSVATPESAAATPEAATPETATPESATPESAASTPETAASTPETAGATPETAAATPEAATPETATPESATPESASTPETAAATPETTGATPETAAATPEAATPEAATPESTAATPETAAAIPETATPESAAPRESEASGGGGFWQTLLDGLTDAWKWLITLGNLRS
ncbi:Ig-like domain-containing protein [uncultured Gemmiger sp.]|uniref:Ig-like domain-containing protein n=1 Tax=uncultured Gemmiger sp. TaxID=1623490 RepID=UPI0025E152AE|nr:Ig-like domain-containing protein [uncultured Gemmiger sp.]